MKLRLPAASAAMLPALAALALTGCIAPIGPVEVTRFHQPESVAQLGHGTIAVESAPGMDPNSLELASYKSAVSRELVRIGYTVAEDGTASQVAQVRLERSTYQPDPGGSPVSVGLGGSTGSYGSGLGVGIGLNLSGTPKAQVVTRLGVMIRDRASGQTLWEGRASFAVSASAPLAQSQLGAPKMAAALFQDFPGNDGETVEVK
ncbi:MAG: hypothetical protein H6R45_314 [Proteobacteria bacterium]|nr:hypothetical protein [Pseudomonadota bacterium]